MTTAVLADTYVAYGYVLAPGVTQLDIYSTATVAGAGVYASQFATIINDGAVRLPEQHSPAIDLNAGGVIRNDASGLIEGPGMGIQVNYGTLRLTNLGTVKAGGTGVLTNTSGGNGDVTIVNGSGAFAGALIEGYQGLSAAYGTVANFGTVKGDAREAIVLYFGGRITNGSLTDTQALISGERDGVATGSGTLTAAATVVNYAVIQDTGVGFYGAPYAGIYLGNGGKVTNGAPTDRGASIAGFAGVVIKGSVETVANFGTVHGTALSYAAINLYGAGSVTNGGGADRAALIEGGIGISVAGGAGTVANFGAIEGDYRDGVDLHRGGAVTNGSANNKTAAITGYTGVYLAGAGSIVNLGVISGLGDNFGFGVYLLASGGGASLVNGSAANSKALIQGFDGVRGYGPATITNFGTISGASGTAVQLLSANETLVVETGCAFQGAVLGGGGTLDLDTGTGTLSGLFSSGGNVTVSGSMAATTFQAFNTVEIGASATFATTGAVTLASNQTIVDAGLLTLGAKSAVANAGTIEVTSGTLTVAGAVSGAGSALIGGGTLDFTAAFNQAVKFTGSTGVLELAQSQTYTAAITGFSKSGGTFLDLLDIAFVSAGEATYAGNSKGGVLTVTDGTHTAHINLKGNYLSSTFVAASDGHGGVIIHDPTRPPASAPAAANVHPCVQPFAAAIAGFTVLPQFADADRMVGGVGRGSPSLADGPSMLVSSRTHLA